MANDYKLISEVYAKSILNENPDTLEYEKNKFVSYGSSRIKQYSAILNRKGEYYYGYGSGFGHGDVKSSIRSWDAAQDISVIGTDEYYGPFTFGTNYKNSEYLKNNYQRSGTINVRYWEDYKVFSFWEETISPEILPAMIAFLKAIKVNPKTIQYEVANDEESEFDSRMTYDELVAYLNGEENTSRVARQAAEKAEREAMVAKATMDKANKYDNMYGNAPSFYNRPRSY